MPDMDAQASGRQSAIAKVLQTHPGVRQAELVRDGYNGFAAFVVPDDAYVDDVLGRGASSAITVRKWRKASDLSLLTKGAALAPVGFNTTGWNSSYTRQPIPVEQMHEWVESTVEDILQLAPKMVYEIGCGTGMLLMRIAPYSDRYVAVDVSPVALESLKKQLDTVPSVATRIEIVERGADNFDGIEENAIDTVVLNSVAQYFPNAAYLTGVLGSAIRVVRPGGHIYIGDVRSLPLLPAFASSVEIVHAADEVGIEELRNRIRRRIEREQELLISPAYFLSLQRRFSKPLRVEVRPRRGRADNEMARYRYSAVLHVGRETEDSCNDEFYDWAENKWTLEEIRSMLLRRPNRRIGIKRIQNARIEMDLAALAMLREADAAHTAGELRHGLRQYVAQGVHPQSLIDLETGSFGFAVFLSWAACRTDGSFDAFFVPTGSLHQAAMPAIGWPEVEASALVRLTNAPGQRRTRDELVGQLIEHCRRNLPENTMPYEIILVDAVPCLPDGRIDTLALVASIRNTTL